MESRENTQMSRTGASQNRVGNLPMLEEVWMTEHASDQKRMVFVVSRVSIFSSWSGLQCIQSLAMRQEYILDWSQSITGHHTHTRSHQGPVLGSGFGGRQKNQEETHRDTKRKRWRSGRKPWANMLLASVRSLYVKSHHTQLWKWYQCSNLFFFLTGMWEVDLIKYCSST